MLILQYVYNDYNYNVFGDCDGIEGPHATNIKFPTPSNHISPKPTHFSITFTIAMWYVWNFICIQISQKKKINK